MLKSNLTKAKNISIIINRKSPAINEFYCCSAFSSLPYIFFIDNFSDFIDAETRKEIIKSTKISML